MANSNTGDNLQSRTPPPSSSTMATATGAGAGPQDPSLEPSAAFPLATHGVSAPATANPALAGPEVSINPLHDFIGLQHVDQGPTITAVAGAATLASPFGFDSHMFNDMNHTLGRAPTRPGKPDHRAKLVYDGCLRLTVSGSEGKRKMMPTFVSLSKYPWYSRHEFPGAIRPPGPNQVTVELTLDLIKLTPTKKKSVKESEEQFVPPQQVILRGRSDLLLYSPQRIHFALRQNVNVEMGEYRATLVIDGQRVWNFPQLVVVQHTRENNSERINGAINSIRNRASAAGPFYRPDPNNGQTAAPASAQAFLGLFASSTATSPVPSSPTASQLSLATSSSAGSCTQYGLSQLGTPDTSFVQYGHTAHQTQEPSAHTVGAQTVQSPSCWVKQPGVAGPTALNTIGSQYAAIQPSQSAPTMPNHILPGQLTQEQMVTVVTALVHAGLFPTMFPAHGSSTSAPALANPFMTQAMQPAAALPGFSNSMGSIPAQQQPLACGHSGHVANHMVMSPGTVSATMAVPQDLALVTQNMAQQMGPNQFATPAFSPTAAYPQLPTNQVHQTASAAPPMTDLEVMLMFLDNPSSTLAGQVIPAAYPDTSMAAPNQVLASPPPPPAAFMPQPPSPTLSLDTASSFADYEISASSPPDVNSYGSEYVDWRLVEMQASAAGGIGSCVVGEDDTELMAGFEARSQRLG